MPHVYLATGDSGIVLEGDSQNSPLVVLANDEAGGAGSAFGYATLAELRGAVAVTGEDNTTLSPADSEAPALMDTTGDTHHARK